MLSMPHENSIRHRIATAKNRGEAPIPLVCRFADFDLTLLYLNKTYKFPPNRGALSKIGL